MKIGTVIAVASLSFLLGSPQAQAVTVWYQPTPFPSNVDASIPDAAKHFIEGWVAVDQNFTPIQLNNTTLQQDDWLYVGGADADNRYVCLMKFDLTGLPKQVDSAIFWLDPGLVSSPLTPSPYAAYLVTSPWNGASSWSVMPSTGQSIGWYPTPTAGNWAPVWAEYPSSIEWYNQWQSGALTNNGIMIIAQSYTSTLDAFVGSRYPAPYDGARPILQLTFTPPVAVPDFKMPLPGGASWLLTNEVGGYECTGSQPWPDTAHQGSNYFSVDFAPANHDANGNTVYTGNIPIIAAADGVVVQAGIDNPDTGNGYYVVINHNNDSSNATGFSTRYLHMQSDLNVSVGAHVTRGQLLGYMGGTGAGNDGRVHLHFGVRYSTNLGDTEYGSASSMVQYVTVEGWLMKSFQTECQNGTWIRYYSSTNTAYPHQN